MVNENIKKYIEENVLPSYKKNERGHNIDHINYVIRRSLEFAKEVPNINYDMVYVIAAYHDIGHYINPSIHEKISGDMLYEDQNLRNFFSEEEISVMRDAVYDHRASMKGEPRTIYGKIVSSADRNNTVEECLYRTYYYGKNLNPNYSDLELYERAFDVLNKKFGVNGYAKMYFKDDSYEKFLVQLRKLLSDKDLFIKTQKNYIEGIKKEREKSLNYWENVFKEDKEIKYDDWLGDFLNVINNAHTPILDLGCGNGNNTKYLLDKGKEVIACDQSSNALSNIKKNFNVNTLCFNMLDGLPFENDSFEIIIADLSLHYFRERDTIKIINELSRVLKHDGYLFVRVNSVKDINHGAGKGRLVEKNLYETDDGRLKRFFDEDDIKEFFKDFSIINIQEMMMTRYEMDKILFRIVLKNEK